MESVTAQWEVRHEEGSDVCQCCDVRSLIPVDLLSYRQ